MAWGRMDDGFDDHPKVVALLDEEDQTMAGVAIGVWTLCWSWAHRNTRKKGKTPGLVPAGLPRRFFGPAGRAAVDLLVKHGLWDPHESGGWLFHDFGDYLPGEDVREARSEAGKRGAAARWANHVKGGKAGIAPNLDGNLPSACHDGDSNAVTNDGSRAGARRDPTPTPVPKPTSPSVSASAPADGQLELGDMPATDNPPPDETITAQDIVAAFVNASRAAGLDEPTKGIIGKVSRDAKRLLTKENVDPRKLLAAAEAIGENGWQSIEVQLRRLSAESLQAARTQQPSRQGYQGTYPGRGGYGSVDSRSVATQRAEDAFARAARHDYQHATGGTP